MSGRPRGSAVTGFCAVVLLTLAGAGQPGPGQAAHGPQAAITAALLQGVPKSTRTRKGIPGDPVNVALVGTRDEILAAFGAAGWYPTDPVTIRSSLGISASVVFNLPYPRAPVSPLFLWGRRQDLAFQQPAARSARKRHHVRFWRSEAVATDGRPVWVGAATYDRGVGRSATTGLPTHHIAADIDGERDKLMADLNRAGWLLKLSAVPHFGPTAGRNGGGDPYYTDGNLAVGVLHRAWRPGAQP